MAPPHKILKKLNENNSTQILTPNSDETCSRSACSKKNKNSKESKCLQSVISVKKSQDSGSSRLTKQSESSAGRLISNLKPDNKKSNIKSKQISGGATLSKIDTASTPTNFSNKNSTSAKSVITVLKAKENKSSDISIISTVEDSKSTSSVEDTSSEEDTASVSSAKTSDSKMKDKKMKESMKKTKRKKINAALENRRRRNLVNSVNLAIKAQKIFVINSQNPKLVPAIRSALKLRGWLEKCGPEVIPPGVHSRNSETTMKLLKDTPANFEWSAAGVDFSKVKNHVIVNKFPKHIHFTSKVGLCTFLQNFYWFYDPEVADTIVPRTFNIASEKDLFYVTQFYVLSACISLIKLVIHNVNTANSNDLFKNGKVPSEAIDFAVLQIESYVNFREHNELDTLNISRFQNKECSKFLSWFYELTQENGTFITMTFPVIHALYTMCKVALKRVLPFWDLVHLEGIKNLWIIKPANSNCGKGVYVMKRLKDIVEHVQLRTESQFGRYVIQKYIEHPLLIFNTKFDIRQWFLVTSAYPLIIWMYSECYLRFSSQQFSLDDLHESIHLTNNSVQCNYTNGERDEELPTENMWHCESFRRYLNERGLLNMWDEKIYPGMCKGIIGAVLSSQNELIPRSKSFELYGADFMIGEDFTTILIEINSGPCMRYTTSVTKAMCKSCLEDIIKVVVDHKENPNADTGKFRELYKQEVGPSHNSFGIDLTVVGRKIKPQYKFI